MELPYDVVMSLTEFMSELDLINVTKAQSKYNFNSLALDRLELHVKSLSLMALTSELSNGTQTLTNSVYSFKKRFNSQFVFELLEDPSLTQFDSSYLSKCYDKRTTIWFGQSRHSSLDDGILMKGNHTIIINHDLILKAIGQ